MRKGKCQTSLKSCDYLEKKLKLELIEYTNFFPSYPESKPKKKVQEFKRIRKLSTSSSEDLFSTSSTPQRTLREPKETEKKNLSRSYRNEVDEEEDKLEEDKLDNDGKFILLSKRKNALIVLARF